MRSLYCRTLDATGSVLVSDEPLGRGGEGSVFSVEKHDLSGGLDDPDTLVAKLYHSPEEGQRAQKVATMLQNPVDSDSIAWPLAIVFDEQKKFAGYIMRKLPKESFRQWSELSNAKDRRASAKDFNVRYALEACRNLAVAVDAVHDAGHCLGDINESNLFIKTDSTILIVDSDSAQIKSSNGKIFPCLVGKPEYTAAEISKGSFKDNPRTFSTDVFAYAVAAFQMLTGGFHPSDGIYTLDGDSPAVIDKIRGNIYPSLSSQPSKGFKKLSRIPSDALPTAVRAVLTAALSNPKDRRPTLDQIIAVIDETAKNLLQCKKVKQHWFDSRDGSCGWCTHSESTGFEVWGEKAFLKKVQTQNSLPPLKFQDQAQNTAPKRVPLSQISNQNQPPQNNPQQNFNQHQASPYPNQSSGQTSAPQGNAPNNQHQQQPGYSQQNNQQQAQQSPQQPQNLPRKHKGKVILTYADGSRRVRPSYGALFRSNPKMGFHCLKEETPSLFQAWWSPTRPVAQVLGLVIGLVVSLIMAASFILFIPMLSGLFPTFVFKDEVFMYFSWFAAATAGAGAISLFISALLDISRAKKKYGNLDGLKREDFWKTALRFLAIPFFYGPILVVIGLVVGLTALLAAMFSKENR